MGYSARVRIWLYRWTLRGTLRLAEKRVIEGLPVGVLWLKGEECRAIFRKVAEAFSILRLYDPRQLMRFQNDVASVLVERTSGQRAEWVSTARRVRLEAKYVTASDTSALEIASTLVHEGTHAWLDRLGIMYEEPVRARIEAVCFRSQLAFLRRVPDSERLIADIGRQLARDPGYWTDAAFRDRRIAQLRGLGIPEWLVYYMLARIPQRVPANNRVQRSGCSRRSHPAAEPDR